MHSWLSPLLFELGYPRLERWNESARQIDELQLLRSSIKGSFAIFCLPARLFEISTFGTKIHHWMTDKPNDCNFLTHSLSLDKKGLRRLFTGIELLIYKLYVLTGNKPERFEGGKDAEEVQLLGANKRAPSRIDRDVWRGDVYAGFFCTFVLGSEGNHLLRKCAGTLLRYRMGV
jgi:hypothetical protein